MVGLDGATWDVADRLMAEGRMPHLARLVREGVRAPLNSTTPPMTLPSWSSFVTGSSPGVHGIFDFTRRVPGTYGLEFTNATFRRVPTLFRLISERGGRVGSIAVPTTYPPEPVRGVMISGFDSPVATRIDGSFVHPRSLYPELVKRFGGMAFADFQELHIGPGWHDAALDALLTEIPRKEGIARWLLGRERYDAFMVLFGETDTASHHFWMYADPTSPRHPARVPARLRGAIDAVYARCDEALGRLLEAARPDRVCVVSDHGFGGAGDKVLYLNRYLESVGWLRYRSDPAGASGHRTGSGWADRLKGAAVRHLPHRVQEQIVRRLPRAVLHGLESRSRYGDIDFAGTRAWSDEMNYAATIHLNRADRDPQGTITDPEAAASELRELLLAWEIEGRRVVRQVWRREAIYRGGALEDAPDLVLELDLPDGHSYTLLPSARARRGQTWRRLEAHEHVGGKGLGMNGSHRQHGVMVLWGRDIAAGRTVEAGMADPMPTLFAAMGQAIPDHVDGRVLQAAFTRPIRPTWTLYGGELPEATSLRGADAEEVRRRLVSLGYL